MKYIWLTQPGATEDDEPTSLFVPASSIIAIAVNGAADTVIRLIDGSTHIVDVGAITLTRTLGTVDAFPLQDG